MTEFATPEEDAFLKGIKAEYQKLGQKVEQLHLPDFMQKQILESRAAILTALEKKLAEPGVASIDELEETVKRAYIRSTNDQTLNADLNDLEKKEKSKTASEDERDAASDKFNMNCAKQVLQLHILGVGDVDDNDLIAATAKKSGLKTAKQREDEERVAQDAKDIETGRKDEERKAQETDHKLQDQRNAPPKSFAEEMAASMSFDTKQESVTVGGTNVTVSVRGNFAMLSVQAEGQDRQNIMLTEDYVAGDQLMQQQSKLARTMHDEMAKMLKDGLSPEEGKKLLEVQKLVEKYGVDGNIDQAEAQNITNVLTGKEQVTR